MNAPCLRKLSAVVISLSLSLASFPAAAGNVVRPVPMGIRFALTSPAASVHARAGLSLHQFSTLQNLDGMPKGLSLAPIQRLEAPISLTVRELATQMNLDSDRPQTAVDGLKMMRLADQLERGGKPTAEVVRQFAQALMNSEAGRAPALDSIYSGQLQRSQGPVGAFTGEQEARNALGLNPSQPLEAYDVPVEKLRWSPSIDSLPSSTAELPATTSKIHARDREHKDMRSALTMEGKGYNLYLAGSKGVGRKTAFRELIAEIAPRMPTPSDLVTVTNPTDPSEPLQMELSAGFGPKFQSGLRDLMLGLSRALPQLIRSGEFAQQAKEMHRQADQQMSELRASAMEEIRAIKVGEKFGIDHDEIEMQKDGTAMMKPMLMFEGAALNYDDVPSLIEKKKFTQEEWEKARHEFDSKATPAFFNRLEKLGDDTIAIRNELQARLDQGESQAAGALIAQNVGTLFDLAQVPLLNKTEKFIEWQKAYEAGHQAIEDEIAAAKVESGDVALGFTLVHAQGGVFPYYILRGEPLMGGPEALRALPAETLAAFDALVPAAKAQAIALTKKHSEFHKERSAEQAAMANEYQDSLTPAQKNNLLVISSLAMKWAKNYEMFMNGGETRVVKTPDGPEMIISPAERFRVDVLRTNVPESGAPVVYDMAPTVASLTGQMNDDPMELGGGRRILPGGPKMKGGSLLKAHGGFLVVDAYQALTTPGVWDVLMKAVDRGQIEIGHGSPFAAMYGQGYQIENNKVKLVLTGSHFIKDILSGDPEFSKNFRGGIVEFDSRMDYDGPQGAAHQSYLQFFKKIISESAGQLMDMTRDGIQGAFEYGAELTGNQTRLSSVFGEFYRVIKEATQTAKSLGKTQVDREAWQATLKAGADRESLAKRYQHDSMISDHTELVTAPVAKIGQLNGLVVYGEGDFGGPAQITATVSRNPKEGLEIVVSDQQADMAGPSFIKSIETIKSELLDKYGPIKARISVQFEQSYGGIDGDSATLAMRTVIRSALGKIPVLQNRAITGSMGQLGNPQVIGGINQKADVHDIAKARGHMTKENPFVMVMPHKNVQNLALTDDKIQSVKDGIFKVRAIHTKEQAEEAMTGMPSAEIEKAVRKGIAKLNRLSPSAKSKLKSKKRK